MSKRSQIDRNKLAGVIAHYNRRNTPPLSLSIDDISHNSDAGLRKIVRRACAGMETTDISTIIDLYKTTDDRVRLKHIASHALSDDHETGHSLYDTAHLFAYLGLPEKVDATFGRAIRLKDPSLDLIHELTSQYTFLHDALSRHYSDYFSTRFSHLTNPGKFHCSNHELNDFFIAARALAPRYDICFEMAPSGILQGYFFHLLGKPVKAVDVLSGEIWTVSPTASSFVPEDVAGKNVLLIDHGTHNFPVIEKTAADILRHKPNHIDLFIKSSYVETTVAQCKALLAQGIISLTDVAREFFRGHIENYHAILAIRCTDGGIEADYTEYHGALHSNSLGTYFPFSLEFYRHIPTVDLGAQTTQHIGIARDLSMDYRGLSNHIHTTALSNEDNFGSFDVSLRWSMGIRTLIVGSKEYANPSYILHELTPYAVARAFSGTDLWNMSVSGNQEKG